jgi:hypothetical protein
MLLDGFNHVAVLTRDPVPGTFNPPGTPATRYVIT